MVVRVAGSPRESGSPRDRAMRGAEQELDRALAAYQELSRAEGKKKSRVAPELLLVLEKLKGFASGSVKRCKDKILEEAFHCLAGIKGGLGDLDREDVLPLVRCILAFQLQTTSNAGSFCRLEKIIVKLSEGNESLLSEEVDKLMGSLIMDNKPLPPGSLQAVCMFVDESTFGRRYWKNNLMPLLRCAAATFDFLSLDQGNVRDEAWRYVTVKVCLQLFKWMPEEMVPLVWDGVEDSKTLQRIFQSLVQIIVGKTACKDTCLLAGTALSMLVNTAPQPWHGAEAILGLYRFLSLQGGPDAQQGEGKEDNEKGEFRFGRLQLLPSTWGLDGWERLVLTRSLLASCKKEILSCRLDGNPQQTCLLLDVLFPAVLDLMEKPMDCRYYCFQVFCLWFGRLQESLEEIWKIKEERVLADDSSLLKTLSQFLWNNAESPVEGASELIRSSFELLMEVYSLECDHFEVLERALYEQFLQRIILTPWQARTRYFALISILPYLGPGKVLELYQALPQHLLNCLSANYLCPVASDVYKAILQLHRRDWAEGPEPTSEEELAQKWGLHWLPTLSSALTSPDSFLQSNTANYLLAWTLRLFPASSALLAESFSGGDSSQLRAWVTLLSVRKTITGVLPEDRETLERLTFCLCAQEDGVRLSALGLLCSSPRTNQGLSAMEFQLLKEFLPLNLNSDSSCFRQRLQVVVKKTLVRLRDSSLAHLRKQLRAKKEPSLRHTPDVVRKDPETPLDQVLDFVAWLWELCVSSLMLGPNYQRKKTCLLLLSAILETCTDSWSPERKKGQPPRDMAALLSWARSRGCWDFSSRSSTLALLSCLQDSTNEIRELASDLLIHHFPSPFPEPMAAALFEQAQELMRSPRVQEVEAGAVLMKTILHKLDGSTLKQLLPLSNEESPSPSPCLGFLEHLLGILGLYFSLACQDFLQAVRTTPIHGVISALRRCLLEVPEVPASLVRDQHIPHWQSYLSRLVDTLRDISRFLLGILQNKISSRFDQQAAAPSFADMGNAIGCLIRLGNDAGSQEDNDSVLLSEQHGLILTCCWVSVKEIGLLLGGLAEMILPLAPPSGFTPLLPLHVVNTAAETFRDILLKCRHWGAVKGCSLGFTKLCAALLRHPDLELQAIPKTMLAQGLALLRSPRSCSITRRAAGFPMLFLCIVAGKDPVQTRPLLARCIQTLLALANEPLPHDWDQTVDLPQVSAVHILQTLVRGSALGTALHPHILPLVLLFLKALNSPSWAMKNAAIQLFGALTGRLLGQKRMRDDDGRGDGGLSPEGLFGCFPELRNILLGELVSAAEVSVPGVSQRGKLHVCPSLYAVLTFLAKLQPSSDTLNRDTFCFLKPLMQLSGNPIYAVRGMAAEALVPLVPVGEYGNLLLQLISSLPLAEDDGLSCNALHGCLLQIQAVLAHALRAGRLTSDMHLSITHGIEDRISLLTAAQRCPLVRIAYLHVASLVMESCSQSFARQVREILNRELVNLKPPEKPGFSQVQVGLAVFCQQAACFLCHEAVRLGCLERTAELCLLLQKGTTDVQVAVLTWLIEKEEREALRLSEMLQLTLWEKLREILKAGMDRLLLKLYLEAFVRLYENLPAQNSCFLQKPHGTSAIEHIRILMSMVESNCLAPELRGHALCVLTLLLVLKAEDYASWKRWCGVIEQCADALAPEMLRIAVAKSLKIAGPHLVQRSQEPPCSAFRPMALCLISAGICLLQDEDQEVRKEASIFASLLAQGPLPVLGLPPQSASLWLQTNNALLSMLKLSLEQFRDEPETFVYLVRHLPTTEARGALIELETKGASSLYKEDEPNVYVEPAVLSQILLPFLLQLLERAPTSPKLWKPMEVWLKTTGPSLFSDLQSCRLWWNQGNLSLQLKALFCPEVHIAIAVLLVKAVLAICMLENMEGRELPAAEGIGFTSQDLRAEVVSVQKLLAQHGMAPGTNLEELLKIKI